MSQPYLGMIAIYGFNFAPRGWGMCNGQIMSIAQNTALFSLLGTMYGGNGTTTFALPDLRSRVPLHIGQGSGLSSYVQGEMTGTESTTLTAQNMPAHNHTANYVNANGNSHGVAGGALANVQGTNTNIYSNNTAPTVPLHAQTIGISGSN